MKRLLRFLAGVRHRRALRDARDARRRGDPNLAVKALERALAVRPDASPVVVQYGHALKDAGRPDEAILAYRQAAAAMPQDADVRLHLAVLLRGMGDTRGAALMFGEVLAADPLSTEALQALAELGARDGIPDVALDRAVMQARARQAAALETALRDAQRHLALAAYPPARFDQFVTDHSLEPPAESRVTDFSAIVLARGAHADAVQASLSSLAENQRVIVVADDTLLNHPVASGAWRDHRLTFAVDLTEALVGIGEGPVLLLVAGAVLRPGASAWFSFAAARHEGGVCFGDHDEQRERWRVGTRHGDPHLFGQPDPLWLATTLFPPIVAWASAAWLRGHIDERGDRSPSEIIRDVLLAATVRVHVPRLVASMFVDVAPDKAERAPQEVDFPPGAKITVIVPTRDQAVLLEQFVDSLLRTAADRARIDVLVVNNRSIEHQTRRAFARLRRRGVRIIDFDEPFNWSRANNRGAAAAADADIFVFANNDMTMLSEGWDVAVERRMSLSETGVVGARLLYPDGSYQHAGIVLGVSRSALSLHEGIGHDGSEGGPDDRWLRARQVSAVTGAFLATRRTTLSRVGGFDEELAIAYNDIDFCLAVRALGLWIVYDPAISLTHHESKTRGRNVTSAQLGWDARELATLERRWGKALFVEPGYNPQWALEGQPFDGFREPPTREVLDWIDRSASGGGWKLDPPASRHS